MKPTQRNCLHLKPNVYISHIGTNDLPTDMTPEDISEKIFTFSKHLKSVNSEVFVSGIVPRGEAEAVNKLLKETYQRKYSFYLSQ